MKHPHQARGLEARGTWCPEPESNRHDRLGSRDFKSLVSTSFTIRALLEAGVGIEPAYTALQAAA